MLIVEDDQGLRPSLRRFFSRRGYAVIDTAIVAEATTLLRQRNIDVLLLDMNLPDGSGLEVLRIARDLDTEIVAIVMTAFPEVKTAVGAMKEGASDFVVKPFELDELQLAVERAVETRTLRRNVRLLQRERQGSDQVTEILGESAAIEQVRELIRKVASTGTPILVTGETGTGKELVADAIHRLSSRSAGPMVKVNCSTFPEQLLESELFGHEKGAFTDAREARSGLFEMANGGTLFLDEIGESSPAVQTKLLRVVEGQPFRRVGGQREVHTDVRVIAATNRELSARARRDSFREDLFFRLNTFQIQLPPLRARGSDIVSLARFFLQRSASALRKGAIRLDPQVEDILLNYTWPGNVRELRNMMERAAILCEPGEAITAAHLPTEIQAAAFVSKQGGKASAAMPSLSEIERLYISHVVTSVGENLSEAARVLGVSRNTLKAKLLKSNGPSSE